MNGADQPFIMFGAPDITQEDIDAVVATLKSGWIGTGPKTSMFENRFLEYKGASYAAAVNSCTAALHLSLIAAGVERGDEVITTPLTFSATVNAIIHCGAVPVLADIDPITMNLDPQEVQRKITSRTKAIVPVHFAGRPCDMNALTRIAADYGLKIIEDCAHAIETEYKGFKSGTIGDFGCFSFYVTKNVTTVEGGIVLAKRAEDIAKIRSLALHGMSKDAWKRYMDTGYKHYQIVEPGFKYNMIDVLAALGIGQLKRVEQNWQIRQSIWQMYNDKLQGLPIRLPAVEEENTRHAYHLYTILIDRKKTGISRDQMLDALEKENIGVGVHYVSIPEHPYYRKAFGWDPEAYPHAFTIGRQTVSLPLSPRMSKADVDRVINAVWKILNNNF